MKAPHAQSMSNCSKTLNKTKALHFRKFCEGAAFCFVCIGTRLWYNNYATHHTQNGIIVSTKHFSLQRVRFGESVLSDAIESLQRRDCVSIGV